MLIESNYTQIFRDNSAAELIKKEVLRLTYTSADMKPFANDMGYLGIPYLWDEEERRHSRARLDALYFILYGLEQNDAEYIFNTFPIIKKQDKNVFSYYKTKQLILSYMAALPWEILKVEYI